MQERKHQRETAAELDPQSIGMNINLELFKILLEAGLDINTIKDMVDHKKKTSLQTEENSKKLVLLNS